MKTVKIKLSRVAQTLVPGGLFALLSYLHMHVFLLHIPIKLPHLVCESKVSSSSPLLMLKRPSYRWAANVCLTLKKLSHPGNVCKTNYCILSRQLTPFPRVYQFPRAQSPPKPLKDFSTPCLQKLLYHTSIVAILGCRWSGFSFLHPFFKVDFSQWQCSW